MMPVPSRKLAKGFTKFYVCSGITRPPVRNAVPQQARQERRKFYPPVSVTNWMAGRASMDISKTFTKNV
jgi:hypothetical protein